MTCIATILLIIAIDQGQVEPVAAGSGTAVVRERGGAIRVWVLHPRHGGAVCTAGRGRPA